MKVFEHIFRVNTNKRSEMIDITDEIQLFIREKQVEQGEVFIFCPHTTGAITINENADPDVQHDLLMTLDHIFPKDVRGYRHGEGNSDSHVKCSLVGCSEKVLIKDTNLVLGTWQGIYFCEFDGPRSRKVMLRVCAY